MHFVPKSAAIAQCPIISWQMFTPAYAISAMAITVKRSDKAVLCIGDFYACQNWKLGSDQSPQLEPCLQFFRTALESYQIFFAVQHEHLANLRDRKVFRGTTIDGRAQAARPPVSEPGAVAMGSSIQVAH